MRGTRFAEMAAFVAIAEQRSFAKAAAHLGVSRSALSQSLRALEESLGVRLLNRTTRSVAPTEAGQRLLARLRPALGEVASAIAAVNQFQREPSGLLRLVVQPPVADLWLGPILTGFLARHPGIKVEIAVVKMPGDIVGEGFDAGIRIGEQIDRDMIALPLREDVRFVAVAAPAYLARHPRPKTPRDLLSHNCVRSRFGDGTVFGWEFVRKGRAWPIAVDGSVTTDDIDLGIRAVLDGVGVGYLLEDYIADDIAAGRLVPLLEEWAPRLSGFFLYYPSRRQVPPPLRAFIDFLRSEITVPGRKHRPPADRRTATRPHFRFLRRGRR